MEVEIGQYKWTMEKDLVHKLDLIKNLMRKNDNFVLLIDGDTGSGKTTLAIQIARYIDPNFSVKHLIYDADDYINKCLEAPKYSAVVYDEAYRDWSSKRTMTSISHRLNAMMMEIRQNNLFHIIVLPSFFDLNKTMAIFGSDSLIHVYKDSNMRKGLFNYYHKDFKKYLYISGHKFYNYRAGKRLMRGTFTSYLPIDEEKYMEKKKNMLQRLRNAEEEKPLGPMQKRHKIQRDALIYILKDDYNVTFVDMTTKVNKLTGFQLNDSAFSRSYHEFCGKFNILVAKSLERGLKTEEKVLSVD